MNGYLKTNEGEVAMNKLLAIEAICFSVGSEAASQDQRMALITT